MKMNKMNETDAMRRRALERGIDTRVMLSTTFEETGTVGGSAIELGVSRMTLLDWIHRLGGRIVRPKAYITWREEVPGE